MKPHKSVVFVVFLGLLLFAFAIGIAQDPANSNQKKQPASCCATPDSCPMKEPGAAAEAEGCCCCQSESCDQHEKNHAGDGCCSDSCDMKAKREDKQAPGEATCCKAKQQAKTKQKTR